MTVGPVGTGIFGLPRPILLTSGIMAANGQVS